MRAPVLSSSNLSSLRRLGLILQKCMKSKALPQGKQAHALLLTLGIEAKTQSLSPKLVGAYASCGDLSSAKRVFDKIQIPTTFALNWMILGSTLHGYFEDAIKYFSLLRQSGTAPNKFTLPMILKACIGLMDLGKGKEVHAVIITSGHQSDSYAGNGLIDMYCKCGRVDYAHQVFDGMRNRDVASWTSMICGYSNTGRMEKSVELFEDMKAEGLQPNHFTWNAIISGFARKGDSDGAFKLYSRMTGAGLVPDLATWNALISGFTQSHQPVEAIILFEEMLAAGIKPNHTTVTGVLPAFRSMNSMHRAKEIHCLIYRLGLCASVFVGCALIDMYSKCGSVTYAQNVFHWVPVRNVPLWNSMIGCYGRHGMAESSIQLFEMMLGEGFRVNDITLTNVLSACSHGGLVEPGLKIFRSMKELYGVEVTKEHYACAVDLLSRSGQMVEADELVKGMPMGITDSVVGAFFNGCRIHGRRDLSKMMAEEVLSKELNRPGGFVTLSNIYAANGEWEEVEDVRQVMKGKGVHKMAGFSGVGKRGSECAGLVLKQEGNNTGEVEGAIQ